MGEHPAKTRLILALLQLFTLQLSTHPPSKNA
jgi:hypothetical protein